MQESLQVPRISPETPLSHAAIWDKDADIVTDLGTLGGLTSSAFWTNDQGEIVRGSVIAYGINTHAFRVDKGKMIDLGTLGGSTSAAGTVNSRGIIIGESDISTAIDPYWEFRSSTDLFGTEAS